MAFVLCTGADRSLTAKCALLLERGGHCVVKASVGPEVLAKSQQQFDVAVIGPMIGNPMKRYMFHVVKERCPEVKVLEITAPFRRRALPDADDWLDSCFAAPAALSERVARLASQREHLGVALAEGHLAYGARNCDCHTFSVNPIAIAVGAILRPSFGLLRQITSGVTRQRKLRFVPFREPVLRSVSSTLYARLQDHLLSTSRARQKAS